MTDLMQPDHDPEAGGERSLGESAHTWTFDKFSEPRTMPAHWNLSEMMGSAEPTGEDVTDPGMQAEPPAAAALPLDAEGVDAVSAEWHRNPFPEPRTYPTHWDLYS
jgi:hypothetical protein